MNSIAFILLTGISVLAEAEFLKSESSKVFGVNYGNRFIPEDWMGDDQFYKNITAQGHEPGKTNNRVSLADIPSDLFRERMLGWLDQKVQESDFQTMQDNGVQVLRVPTGYWNWITLPGNTTPNGPDSQRMKNLQTVPPSDYLPYFEKIFTYAEKYGVQVLLDLHGAPGSQNGEVHSGLVTSEPHFNTEWNLQLAVQTIEAMAQYGATKSNLYGIELLNEPNHYSIDMHSWLDSYFKQAIEAAREHVSYDVKIVVFSWTYDFDKWPDNAYGLYGNVIFDTHIYHVQGAQNLTEAEHNYWNDLEALQSFHKRQGGSAGGAIVGEWSLAGPSFDADQNQQLASWLVWCFAERSHGSIFWNLDAPYNEWSLEQSAKNFHIDWKNMPKPTTSTTFQRLEEFLLDILGFE